MKNSPLMDFPSLEKASINVFKLLKDQIGINTFFIAKNDGVKVDVMKTLNKKELLIEEGFQIDYDDSY